MTGYIYKITNQINQKAYIGKTVYTVDKRWKEHLKDYTKREEEHRPLYKAMQKYGIENFTIEQIEEVDIKELSNREMYWIEYFHTFSNGYNATLGGDGKILYDYDLIAQLIQQQYRTEEICEMIHCCPDTVRMVAQKCNLSIARKKDCTNPKKEVYQFDKQGNYLRSFESYSAAAQWLKDNGYIDKVLSGVRTHIGEVCNGKRKTAYQFIWRNNL